MTKKYEEVEISKIIVKDRLRKVDDEDYILLLQENISEIGLIEPIVIDTKNVLLAGGHRLKACLNLGMKTIPCLRQPETTNDEDLKRVIEVSENLIRKNLSAKDTCIQYNILAEYYKNKGVKRPAAKMAETNNDTERMNYFRIKIGELLQKKNIYSKLSDDITITSLIQLTKSPEVVDNIIIPSISVLNEKDIKEALNDNRRKTNGFGLINAESSKKREELEELEDEVDNNNTNTNNSNSVNLEVEHKIEDTKRSEETDLNDFIILKNDLTEFMCSLLEESQTSISKSELKRILIDSKSKIEEFISKC
jgi:ParB family chromosome partitioning protein